MAGKKYIVTDVGLGDAWFSERHKIIGKKIYADKEYEVKEERFMGRFKLLSKSGLTPAWAYDFKVEEAKDSYKRKYRKGTVIKSLCEFQFCLDTDNFVYFHDKILHKDWIGHWSLIFINIQISSGNIRRAILNG